MAAAADAACQYGMPIRSQNMFSYVKGKPLTTPALCLKVSSVFLFLFNSEASGLVVSYVTNFGLALGCAQMSVSVFILLRRLHGDSPYVSME